MANRRTGGVVKGMSRRMRHGVFGVMGSDLSHTLSPRIHNLLFKRAGLDCSYVIFEVGPLNLRRAVDGIRALGIRGVNVTFPYKEDVIPYLDRLDADARKTGAVNTIRNSGGELTGYNTDVFGLRSTLEDRMKIDLAAKTVVLLGAGGAARACLWVLLSMEPARVLIANRTAANARTMAAGVNGATGKTRILPSLLSCDEEVDLLINATSAGPGLTGRTIAAFSKRGLFNRTAVLDLNYGGRALSGEMPDGVTRYEDGLYMLCAQAVESSRIWTGTRPDAGSVHRALRRHVAGQRKKR